MKPVPEAPKKFLDLPVTLNGETKTASEWCVERGLDPLRVYHRRARNTPWADALMKKAPGDALKKSGDLRRYFKKLEPV